MPRGLKGFDRKRRKKLKRDHSIKGKIIKGVTDIFSGATGSTAGKIVDELKKKKKYKRDDYVGSTRMN